MAIEKIEEDRGSEAENLRTLEDWLRNPEERFAYFLTERLMSVRLNATTLDYPNVFEQTSVVRMHVFLGPISREVSDAVKLKRMQIWARDILLYDEMMEQQVGRVRPTKESLEHLLSQNMLPRPEQVELGGGAPGLRRLYEQLGFEHNTNEGKEREFVVPWNVLVELARSGDWVNRWRELKGLS